MRPRRRSYQWEELLGIDVPEAPAGESFRDPVDAPAATSVLSVFSGVMWSIAVGMLFLDPRAGVVAGAVATFTVWLAARRR